MTIHVYRNDKRAPNGRRIGTARLPRFGKPGHLRLLWLGPVFVHIVFGPK